MIYLILSVLLFGLIPIVQLIDMNKISILFIGLISSVPLFLPFINIRFIKENFRKVAITGILRSIASICYFYSFDIGVGPMVVCLVFSIPVLYSLFDSIHHRKFNNLDLVLVSSLGCFLLLSKMPSFEFNWKILVATGSPFFSSLALYYFKNNLKVDSFKDTVSTVLFRNMLILIIVSILFYDKLIFNLDVNLLYSCLYGFFILGIAMMTFFHSSKLMDAKIFSLLTNIEYIISFFIMIFVFGITVTTIQYIGLGLVIFSIFVLKLRKLKTKVI